MSWIQRLFCGGLIGQVDSLKTENEKLEKDKTRLHERLQDADTYLENCQVQLFEAEKQIALLNSQIETLNKWLVEAIQIPDIISLINLDTMKTIDPYMLPSLTKYYLTVADTEYYTFPKETWQLILDLVYKEIKETAKTWKKNIFDCDNFSTTTQDVASLAFMNAKLPYQGAIMIAWSGTHAYNVFLDLDNIAWIYEPQTNQTIGKLGETNIPYDTRLLWIPT